MPSLGQTAIGALMQGYQFGAGIRGQQFQREQLKKQAARQDESFRMRREKHTADMDAMHYTMTRAQAQNAMAPIIYGMRHDQEIAPELYKKANEASGGALLKLAVSLRTPRQRQAAKTLEAAMNPQNDVSYKDPNVIASANILFTPELLEGVGEKITLDGKEYTIERKFINKAMPNPNGDGLMLDLGVIAHDKEGNVRVYNAPATKGRGTGEDDLIADIPLDKLMKKVQGLSGMARMLEQNPKFLAGLEQMAVGYGVDLSKGNAVTLKEVKSGDKILTYAVDDAGSRTLIASAPRFKPEGADSKNPKYSLANSMLKSLFAASLDANGNAVFGSDETKDDYAEANKLANEYIDDGMAPGKAVYKAYRAVADYTLSDSARKLIDDRIAAQLDEMEKSGKGYSASSVLGFEYDEKYGGMGREDASYALRLRYERYYKDHGELPDGYLKLGNGTGKGGAGSGTPGKAKPAQQSSGTAAAGLTKPGAASGGLNTPAEFVPPPPEAPIQSAAQFVPPPATPEPVTQENVAQLAQSALAKASRGEPLALMEKQALIAQAEAAIAAGKDPKAIMARLQELGVAVTLEEQ